MGIIKSRILDKFQSLNSNPWLHLNKMTSEHSNAKDFNLFVCPMCRRKYNQQDQSPHELSCKHIFCASCIKDLLNKESTEPEELNVICCPICQEFLPQCTRIDDLVKADYIFQIKDALDCNTQNVGNSCQACKLGQDAISWCGHCRQEICQYCADVHSTMSSFKDHTVSALIDPDIDTLKMIEYCLVHRQCTLSYYCATCKKIICPSCKELEHADEEHDVSPLEDIHKVRDEEFSRLVTEAQSKQTQSIDYISKAKMSEATLQTNVALAIKNVYEIRKELDDMIDCWMRNQLEKIEQTQRDVLNGILSDKEHVLLQFNFLGHDLDYLKPLTQSDKSMALRSAQKHCKPILAQLVKQEIPELPMDSYLVYKLNPEKIACLPLILEGFGLVHIKVNLAKTSFKIPAILKNQNAEITVLPSDESGSSSMGGLQMKASVVTPSGESLELTITLDNGDGTYTVKFKPNMSGLHKLQVSFPNQEHGTLEHSFPVHDVSCHSTTEFNEFFDLIITPVKKTKAEDISKLNDVVTELVDPTGTKMQSTEKKYFGGVYIHRYKPILLGDHKINLHLKGKLIGELNINVYQSWKWEHAQATDVMSIEKDHFFVCGRGKFNKDKIMMIGSDGRYISSDHLPEQCLLLTLCHEKLIYGLFKDGDNYKVQSFDQNWQQLTTTNINDLQQPTALVVTKSKHILICDRKLSCIFMCAVESNIISKIGSKGKELEYFLEPSDMCIMGDNELLVCDSGNKRLQLLDMLGKCKEVFSQDVFSDCLAISFTSDDDLVVVTTKQLHHLHRLSSRVLQTVQLKCLGNHTGIGKQIKHKVVCLGNTYAVVVCSVQGLRSTTSILMKYSI
ncbi:tripartite motif-containing protein 45-like [Anneissia japonica]|uniref:tripartite motif-containing protein 45-like n=1 Tax=Anneissia japonica TaxID=1529436 RepID=UPI00142559AC|nr:tripartite motif-containing protein 45-like [Anneissia japonica]